MSNDYIERQEKAAGMDSSEFQRALDASEELRITVTGRKTGREHSTPVWFVREGKTILLLPVSGSKNQWYKNVLRASGSKVAWGKVARGLSARPMTDPKRVAT